ncbi:glycine C-acetyltransferase [Propionispira arboris]|uniref:8-amino-7-ketopelargonate synthase n=1 Tax=Propionispira arboris TaxID=84035 RepID=A0A1H6ZCT5_9FIRM|nr:8-amino-7-oxononanoate synthase [Propionispira arboris]SEJ51158.1 glycine C-acetyltransferase [Propionispira arboris]
MQKLTQIKTQLLNMHAEAVLRQLHEFHFVDPVHVCIKNEKYLLMASNNYLGLTHHPAVKAAAAAAIEEYGTGSGGSRLTSGNHPLYGRLEKDIARFKQTEAALIFNSGYMSNIGVISALANTAADVIFSDALNHASIIDGCRLARAKTVIYPHNNMVALAELLKNTPCSGQRFIITDGVFSMDGDIACLEKIVYLAGKYDGFVIVDDAHATGVIGSGGRGSAAYYGLSGRVHLELGTLSKALASEGGFAAGSQLVINYLINKARSFIFSTALSPATLAAASAALQILLTEPYRVERLALKAAAMKDKLRLAGVPLLKSETPIIPILIGAASQAMDFTEKLYAEKLIVSAIRPPTVPVGSSRLRLTMTGAHSAADIDKASAIIIHTAIKMGRVKPFA